MPFDALGFSDPLYHQERISSLSLEDEVASYLLAINWSTGRGGSGGPAKLNTKVEDFEKERVRNRQLESHLDCVAVAFVKDRWIFSSNQLDLAFRDIYEVSRSFEQLRGYPWVIVNGHANMHAEMKIVTYLMQVTKLEELVKIGVSKPCCPDCAKRLTNLNVEYTSRHGVKAKDSRWQEPRANAVTALTTFAAAW